MAVHSDFEEQAKKLSQNPPTLTVEEWSLILECVESELVIKYENEFFDAVKALREKLIR